MKDLECTVSPCVPVRIVAVTENRTVELLSPVSLYFLRTNWRINLLNVSAYKTFIDYGKQNQQH